MPQEAEYIECWPCPPFNILLNKYYPAGEPRDRKEIPVYCWCRVHSRECTPHTNPLEYKSSPASLGRSHVAPALYVFSLLGKAH